METTIKIIHHNVQLRHSFEVVSTNIEKLLKRLQENWQKELNTNSDGVTQWLQENADESSLMIFDVINHGILFQMEQKNRKALQYIVGNPLIAFSMTRNDIRVGQYVPLRIYLYEDNNEVAFLEYDQPSSLIGQFEGEEIMKIALSLDQKVLDLIQKSDSI